MKYTIGMILMILVGIMQYLFGLPDLLVVLLLLNIGLNIEWISNKITKLIKRRI